MATASSLLIGSWFWMFALGGLATLPLAGAPADLEPRLSAIAPEECLWYAGLAGTQEANPQSDNQVEQLLAEPQVRAFAAEFESQLLRAVRRAAGPGRDPQTLARELPVLIRTALTRPWAAYIEEVQVGQDGVKVEAALVLCAGAERAPFEQSLRRILQLLPPDKTILEEEIDGLRWFAARTKPQAPRVRWTFTNDDDFILAIGDATPSKVLERSQGAAPAWLNALRTEHPLPREASVGYLNVRGILERVRPLIAAQEPEVWNALEKLGVDQIEALHGRSGLDEEGYVSIGHLATSGERRGALGLLPHEPLGARDLGRIPHDVLAATLCRLDPSEAWDHAVRLANLFDPRAEEQLERALWEIESEVGVQLYDDVIKSLGDVWTFYVPGGDLMTSWLGSAATVRVKDANRLQSALEKFAEATRSLGRGGRRGGPSIRETAYGERTVYSLEFSGSPVPIAPAWCVDDDLFVAALMPQTVRSVLDRGNDETLADVSQVRDALDAHQAPAALFYQDTPRLVRSLYPLAQMLLQMASSQLRQQGIELDASILPSVDVLVNHLRPSVGTIAHDGDGFHFVSRTSLPGEGNLAAMAPIGAALLIPAVGGARQAAGRVEDTNRLKQLALAMLNYESAHRQLPGDIYNEQGEPLLSWRVRLLPFMEESNLYQQFRLDERWDSEHNRPLLEQMPAVLQSNGPATPPGQTRFVALRGAATLFPLEETRITLSGVTDGTSNTLLFVQASPDSAVAWTKPTDLEFDEAQPLAHLGDGREGFLAALCDGSVRYIRLTIDPLMMRALVTRNGGEAIDYEAISR